MYFSTLKGQAMHLKLFEKSNNVQNLHLQYIE